MRIIRYKFFAMMKQFWNAVNPDLSPPADVAPRLSGWGLRLAQTAWLVLAFTVAALWLWSVYLWAAGQASFGNGFLDVPYGVVMPAGYFAVAALLVVRKPDDPMAILTSLMLVFLGPYLLTGVNVTVSQQPGWEALSRLLLIVGGILFFLFLFTFPDGRFLNRWMQRLALLLAGVYALGMLLAAEAYGSFSAAFIPAVMLLGLGVQVYRYLRRSSPAQRQQTKWVVLGAVGPVLLVVNWVLLIEPGVYALPADPLLFYLHQSVLAALGLLLPAALAISILRYRLWDIDLIISRTLVYSALTAAVIAIYGLVVGGAGVLFQTQDNRLLALIATGLVAVLFQPLRDRLQHGINRLLYGHRHEPLEVLTRLGQRLEDAPDSNRVLSALAETIAHTLKLPYVALTTRANKPIAAAGVATAQAESFPMVYQRETVGYLWVSPRAPDETFTPAETRLLHNLARQAGPAVHAWQLTADLQHARRQIVAGREEERRRLRRDLHDGLGPSLAAVMLKIGSARALLATRPDLAGQLLAELESDIDATLSDVRRIVYNLRPPTLDQWGLAGALRAYAETCHSPALSVQVDAPDALPPLPAAVEVAAYHIGREALTNVVRHAQARRCTLKLWVEGDENGRLHLTVQDDGCGLPPDAPAGVGLTAMRERAVELGGMCKIVGDAGGTTVTVVLPLHIGGKIYGNETE
ncbi:MAG: hypothetical protein Kow0063_35760 [Anaerolineae bacterium]